MKWTVRWKSEFSRGSKFNVGCLIVPIFTVLMLGNLNIHFGMVSLIPELKSQKSEVSRGPKSHAVWPTVPIFMAIMLGHLNVHFGMVISDPGAKKLKIGIFKGLKIVGPLIHRGNFHCFHVGPPKRQFWYGYFISWSQKVENWNFQGAQNHRPTNP